MPVLEGWTPPDTQAMSDRELREHIEQMQAIGETYLRSYQARLEGREPRPDEIVPRADDMKVWRNYAVPGQGNEVSSGDHGNIAALLFNAFTSVRLEDVVIHPFPGGCAFESTRYYTTDDGLEATTHSCLVWYVNADGRAVRLHEYIDSAETNRLIEVAQSFADTAKQ